MNIGISESAAIGAVALLCAIVNVGLGVRAGRCDRTSALSRFSVAFIALVVAVLVFVPIVSPVAGYGVLCLALVSVFLFDLLREEHTRRRRVASLTPRPAAEPVPSVWVAIAVASVLMLAPYVILGEQRAAALIVGACAFVMAGIAWRIASAPMQLEGEDIQTERGTRSCFTVTKSRLNCCACNRKHLRVHKFCECRPACGAAIATNLASRFAPHVVRVVGLGHAVWALSR